MAFPLPSPQSDDVVTVAEAVGGGFVAVLGARMAAGCTSGHGISGMGHLATGESGTRACFPLFLIESHAQYLFQR